MRIYLQKVINIMVTTILQESLSLEHIDLSSTKLSIHVQYRSSEIPCVQDRDIGMQVH